MYEKESSFVVDNIYIATKRGFTSERRVEDLARFSCLASANLAGDLISQVSLEDHR